MEMEVMKAFETLFGFDVTDFGDVYNNSCMESMFETLEEAREVKKAYEILKEAFDWKEEFSIYKDSNGWYAVWYTVEDSNQVDEELEKIE